MIDVQCSECATNRPLLTVNLKERLSAKKSGGMDKKKCRPNVQNVIYIAIKQE
jgi:hypothetical protein